MLRPHVTTEDLYRVHPDLPWSQFATTTARGTAKYYSKGIDGVIGSDVTLPLAFTSATGAFEGGGSTDAWTVTDPTIILNIPERGFYAITEITDDDELTIDWLPSMTSIINVVQSKDYDYKTVTAGTALKYEVGGYADTLMQAYIDVCMELRKRKTYPSEISDNEPILNNCIIYRALSIIFNAQTQAIDDIAMYHARYYQKMYEKELQTAAPFYSGIDTVAPITWSRSS